MNEKVVLEAISNGFPGKSILLQLQRDGFRVFATADIAYQKTDITRREELMNAIGGEYLYKEIVPRIYPKGKKMT